MIDLCLTNHYRNVNVERKNNALSQLNESVVQIFASKDSADRRFPVSAGSGTLIQLGSRRFLITAAHVIDAAKHTSLYAGINGVLVEVDGTAFVTASDDRDKDLFDFAFMELEGKLAQACERLNFIGKEHFFYGSFEPELTVYMALGYPRSKNKKRDLPGKKVRNRRWSFTTRKAMAFDHGRVGTDPRTHIPVMFVRNRVVDDTSSRVNPISPRGLSGGPLLQLGNAGSPSYYQRASIPALVSGILIENRDDERAVLAVRIRIVLIEIGKKFPDVKRDLPSQLV